jgi:hypothetical protein
VLTLPPLIPAKAGIQQREKARLLAWQKLDPRIRGDERIGLIRAHQNEGPQTRAFEILVAPIDA